MKIKWIKFSGETIWPIDGELYDIFHDNYQLRFKDFKFNKTDNCFDSTEIGCDPCRYHVSEISHYIKIPNPGDQK